MARGGYGVLCHGGPVHRGGGLWLPGGVHPVAGDPGRPARPLAPADHWPAFAGEYAAHVPGPGGDFGHLFPGPPGGGSGHPVGGPAGGDWRRPAGGLRRGGPGPGLRGAALLQPGLYPGRSALRPVPGPQEGMGGLGLCVGLLRGSAVELGRRPPHGPAPGGAGGGHPLPGAPPPPAPEGIRCPHARPEPRLGGRPPGPLPEGGGDGRGLPHPLRQREGDPPSRGSEHGKPGGDLHPGRRQGVRPVRPGGHLLAKGVPGHPGRPQRRHPAHAGPGPGPGHGFFRDLQQPVRPLPGVFGGGEPPAHGLPAAAAGVAADL